MEHKGRGARKGRPSEEGNVKSHGAHLSEGLASTNFDVPLQKQRMQDLVQNQALQSQETQAAKGGSRRLLWIKKKE